MLDPAVLKGLFREPDMFDTPSNWRKAGFVVEGKGGWSSIMVARHPSVPAYLFKKYSRKISLKEQLKNYQRRAEGADKLLALIAAQQLTWIVVPRKYLLELPPEFSRKGTVSYVLVVERMGLLESSQSKQLYRQISSEVLRQLCVVLRAFPGLDSGVRNVPFTRSGQIAFIDTERWADKKKSRLHRLREYLPDEQRRLAEVLLK